MNDWRDVVRARLSELRLTGPAEAELTEELAQHLDDRYRDLKAGGASDEDAFRAVMSELDELCALRDLDGSQHMPSRDAVPIGDATRSSWFADLQRDLRYAGRTMWRSPLFELFVVITLGSASSSASCRRCACRARMSRESCRKHAPRDKARAR
jgi:hypothetical protein